MKRITFALAFGTLIAATGLALADDAPIAPARNDYSIASNWLCLPGHDDACGAAEDATIVAADGTLTPEKFKPAKHAPIDCLYIYPTVSRDPGVNSDMLPGIEE